MSLERSQSPPEILPMTFASKPSRVGAVFIFRGPKMNPPIAANDNGEGVRYLRFPQLKEKKGIHFSRMHIYRLEKQNAFPKRVPAGENSIAWVESEGYQHMIKEIAAR